MAKKKKAKTSLDRFLEKKPKKVTLATKFDLAILVIEKEITLRRALESKVITLQDQIDEIKAQLLHVVFYPEPEMKNEG